MWGSANYSDRNMTVCCDVPFICPVKNCQAFLFTYLSQCIHIHICKQMHKHTCLLKTHHPPVTQSEFLHYTHRHKHTLVCFVPDSNTNQTPTHIMQPKLNRTVQYAITQRDSFSDYRMSRMLAFQTVACGFFIFIFLYIFWQMTFLTYIMLQETFCA